MNKNLLIRILGVSAVAVWIIAGIFSLMMGEYFEAIGLFSLGVLIFVTYVIPQWNKKNQT